jgi:MFS family permease
MRSDQAEESGRVRFPLLAHREFRRFWIADTVSIFGVHVTTLAMQVLAAVILQASVTEIGVLGAARWLPCLLFGLIAGVLVDRHRRRPILVGADLGRAALLGLVPLLALADALSMPLLIGIVLPIGVLSLLYDAAHQSYLPRLMPAALLTPANARLEQTAAVAQTAGPLVAGWLVKILNAPLAVLVDALSYLVSGIVLATLRVPERVEPPARRHLGRELREGLSWVYQHRMLAPLALTSHLWFLFNSMVTTVYVVYAMDDIGIDPFGLGVTYAVAGAGTVLGAALSGRVGHRFGLGPSIVAARWLVPVGYLFVPLASPGTTGLVLLCAAQFLFGMSVGADSPLEMAYRQTVTPDRLLGRMNATMRSLNRGAIVIGAPIGGVLADQIGNRFSLWTAISGLVVSAIILTCSPFRHARLSPESA